MASKKRRTKLIIVMLAAVILILLGLCIAYNATTLYEDNSDTMGWKYEDGKIYYYYQEGIDQGKIPGFQASSYTTCGGIRIPKEGYVSGNQAKALAYGMDVLNRSGWNLIDAYKYSSALRYADHDRHYGFRIHRCALHGFETGEGNCLVWSGTFCTMAKLLGYDARQIWGTLHWHDMDVVHSWVEIEENDSVYVYDPRHHQGKDDSGFRVQYGDEDTYDYNLDSIKYMKW